MNYLTYLDNDHEVPFFGTMSGYQSLSSSTVGQTSTRRYRPLGGSNAIRHFLTEELSEAKLIREGSDYAWSSGRYLGTSPGQFKLMATLSDIEGCEDANSYALRFFKGPLENLSKRPLFYLQNLCSQLGINAILFPYFEAVEIPQNGDMVIYTGTVKSAGIYQTDQRRHCKYQGGGTVRLKWSRQHDCQTDLFFMPSKLGDTAQFFRLREDVRYVPVPTFPHLSGCSKFTDAGVLVYNNSAENDALRKLCGESSSDALERQLGIPILRHLDGAWANCAHYAMTIALAGLQDLPFVGWEPVSTMEFIKTHFTMTKKPVEGDVAVYLISGVSPVHFGIYVSEECIESKWGSDRVMRHPPFRVPKIYGDTIEFYRLEESSFSPKLAEAN